MPMLVDCQSCGGKLRVPDELLGRRVKCPRCAREFEARPPAPEPPPLELPPSSRDSFRERPWPAPSADGPGVPEPGVAPPPAGPLESPPSPPPAAAPPPHDEGDERPWEQPHRAGVRRDCEPHRGPIVLTLGIISSVTGVLSLPLILCCGIFSLAGLMVGLPCGIVAIVMGRRDLREMQAGTMDPQGRGQTHAGWICGIVGTSFCGLAVVGIVVLIVFYVLIFAAAATTVPPRPGPAPGPGPGKLQVVQPPLCFPACRSHPGKENNPGGEYSCGLPIGGLPVAGSVRSAPALRPTACQSSWTVHPAAASCGCRTNFSAGG